jgi:tRNA A37 threonylcarbamoyladenosine modification protein TsaB
VAGGPGSYSGLRVGASTAIGLGLALDVPVVRVPTLEIIAYSATPGAGFLRPAIDLGRGRYASAGYLRNEAAVEMRSDLISVGFDGLVELALAEDALLIGDFTVEEMARRGAARVAANAAGMRRSGFLTELAARVIERGVPLAEGAPQLIYVTS